MVVLGEWQQVQTATRLRGGAILDVHLESLIRSLLGMWTIGGPRREGSFGLILHMSGNVAHQPRLRSKEREGWDPRIDFKGAEGKEPVGRSSAGFVCFLRDLHSQRNKAEGTAGGTLQTANGLQRIIRAIQQW